MSNAEEFTDPSERMLNCQSDLTVFSVFGLIGIYHCKYIFLTFIK